MKKYFLTPDVSVQTLLLAFVLVCYASIFGIIFALLLQFLLGIYQVLSGIYYGFGQNSAWHRRYLLWVLGYFFITFLVTIGASPSGLGLEWLMYPFYTVVPIVMAIFYYNRSLRYHRSRQSTTDLAPLGDADVLDDPSFMA